MASINAYPVFGCERTISKKKKKIQLLNQCFDTVQFIQLEGAHLLLLLSLNRLFVTDLHPHTSNNRPTVLWPYGNFKDPSF